MEKVVGNISMPDARGKVFQIPRHVPVEALELIAKARCKHCRGSGTVMLTQAPNRLPNGKQAPVRRDEAVRVKTICHCAVAKLRDMPEDEREAFIKEHVTGYKLDEEMAQ